LWLEQGFLSGVPYPLTAGPLTHPHDPSLLAASSPSPSLDPGATIPAAALAEPPYWGETPIIRDPCYSSQRAAAYQHSQTWEALRHTSLITIGADALADAPAEPDPAIHIQPRIDLPLCVLPVLDSPQLRDAYFWLDRSAKNEFPMAQQRLDDKMRLARYSAQRQRRRRFVWSRMLWSKDMIANAGAHTNANGTAPGADYPHLAIGDEVRLSCWPPRRLVCFSGRQLVHMSARRFIHSRAPCLMSSALVHVSMRPCSCWLRTAC
jgi:hypothetical protein